MSSALLNLTKEQLTTELWCRNKHGKAILSSAQKRIHAVYEANLDKTVAVECSRQLGKTFYGCYLADLVARTNPGVQIRLASAFHVDIESIIIPNYANVLKTCPESLKPKYLSQKTSYKYKNGSVVTLVGLDKNPDKLRGNRINLVIIEEAGFVDSDNLKYVLESIVFPAQLREPNARTVLISTPPSEGNDHFFCELADQLALKGSYIKMTIDESGLPQAQIDGLAKSLGGRSSIAFRREALCERIIDTEKALIPEFQQESHVKTLEKPSYHQFLTKYASLDTGTRDKTVILHGYYDFPKGVLYIEKEAVLSGAEVTSPAIFELSKSAETELEYQNTRRYADSNDPININNISLLGMHWQPTSKDSLQAMLNKLRMWFKDGRIVVKPNCKFLIGTLRSGLWNNTRTEFKRTKIFGHADAIASLMYLVRNVAEGHNPIPAHFQTDQNHSIVMPYKNQNKAVKSLKTIFDNDFYKGK